ncbi:MAG: cupin domain-containing protein [Planctomycetota bacterium]|nr:cupin domain-containing protein [Planctomycetota bacterium]
MSSPPQVINLSSLPAIPCPCGTARRAFADRDDYPGTVHLTEISSDAKRHYHLKQAEIYIVLECDTGASIELDGLLHPVTPMTAVIIPPGVRHRAIGQMKVIILCTPNFDPSDEYFD